MPHFAKKGASYKFHPRPQKPGSEYSRSFRGQLQRKLEALTEPPQKVTTLAEMSPEKQEEMRRLYARPSAPAPQEPETALAPDHIYGRFPTEGELPWRPKPLKAVTEDDVHGA